MISSDDTSCVHGRLPLIESPRHVCYAVLHKMGFSKSHVEPYVAHANSEQEHPGVVITMSRKDMKEFARICYNFSCTDVLPKTGITIKSGTQVTCTQPIIMSLARQMHVVGGTSSRRHNTRKHVRSRRRDSGSRSATEEPTCEAITVLEINKSLMRGLERAAKKTE